MASYDRNLIARRIYQGSKPDPSFSLGRDVTVLVLTALEIQPRPEAFSLASPGVRLVYAPLDDDGMTLPEDDRAVAHAAAKILAGLHREGETLLVTCRMGLNRSGLVTALTLREIFGCTGQQARLRVQAHRPGALRNAGFSAYLDSLPALPTPRVESRVEESYL